MIRLVLAKPTPQLFTCDTAAMSPAVKAGVNYIIASCYSKPHINWGGIYSSQLIHELLRLGSFWFAFLIHDNQVS